MSSAFFSKRSANALPYCTILRVDRVRPVQFVVASVEPIGYAVHWVGKPMLCPGGDCTACRTQMPRPVYSVIGWSGADRKLCELGDWSVCSMREQLAEKSINSMVGTAWTFGRKSARGAIEPTFQTIRSCSPVMAMLHLRLVARCFQLCDAHEGETVALFQARLMVAAQQHLSRVTLDLDQVDVRT